MDTMDVALRALNERVPPPAGRDSVDQREGLSGFRIADFRRTFEAPIGLGHHRSNEGTS
jgi:hypothetical protein